jgi:hypothetical protein
MNRAYLSLCHSPQFGLTLNGPLAVSRMTSQSSARAPASDSSADADAIIFLMMDTVLSIDPLTVSSFAGVLPK